MRTLGRAVAATAAVLLVGGCGNWITTDFVGSTGVGVDEDGRLVAYVSACSGEVDVVRLAEGRPGATTGFDVDAGLWQRSTPTSGRVVLDLAAPTGGWSGGPSVTVRPRHTYILRTGLAGEDVSGGKVEFTGQQVDDFEPGFVYVRHPDSWRDPDDAPVRLQQQTLDEFAPTDCAHPTATTARRGQAAPKQM